MWQDRVSRLHLKMIQWNIREEDFKEDFIRSSGPGGQNVNKVSSCVVLEHKLTGISVRCQIERSQALNRLKARELLVEKIEDFHLKEKLEHRSALEKQKRKNRKRPKDLKEKILEKKRKQAEKKKMRQKVKVGSWE